MSIKFFQAKVYFDGWSLAGDDDTLRTEAFFLSREKAQAWADQEVKEFNDEMLPPDLSPCAMSFDAPRKTSHYAIVQESEIRD